MHVFFSELGLQEGFDLLLNPKATGFHVNGERVQRPGGMTLFRLISSAPIKCWNCEVRADRWVVERNPKDNPGLPIVNLYGGTQLINRDHVIPRSLGGVNDPGNLRPSCEPCNTRRSNTITEQDLDFLEANPTMFDINLYLEGKRRMLKAVKLHANEAERRKYQAPYDVMDAFLASSRGAQFNSISKQIAPAVPPVVANKKVPTLKPVLKSDEGWVLITNLFEIAKLKSLNKTTRYQQVDGKFIGPYIREKDR